MYVSNLFVCLFFYKVDCSSFFCLSKSANFELAGQLRITLNGFNR